VWANVVMHAKLADGQTLLVHGGAGGIGTHAIQVGKALGATVAVTAGSAERLERCRQLGADITINYKEQDFVEVMHAEAKGADVILDNMGAKYLQRNVDALRADGRLVIIGMQGGIKGELNIGSLLGKRASVFAAGLRFRPLDQKAAIVADVRERLWPLVEDGSVKPIIGQVVPMAEAASAHRMLEEGSVFGKILLAAKS
jgi:NADPH:quinone reductase-like Zn-dependent oxidoreductase